jgi:hypothetical protein
LVPPAPSAFSNSDLVIWPSPFASICENRSFNASSRLVDVEDVELDDVDEVVLPVESVDWLCAAISALIVSGEICAQLPELTEEVAPLVVLLPLSIANGLVAPCEDVEDEDFELVSDWIASSALDTAPRANNIAQLQPVRHAAANVLDWDQQATCQCEKLNEIRVHHALRVRGTSAIHAADGRFFRPQEAGLPCIARPGGPC